MSTFAELLSICLPAVWYGTGTRTLWRRAGRGHGVSVAQTCAFAGGLLVMAIALLSPLDERADALFSAHMVQHLLLILGAAPLLVAGAPLFPMLWALPHPKRNRIGAWWTRSRRARRAMNALMHPGAAFALHTALLWFWHMPRPYQAAVASDGLHAVEHFSFVGSAMLFWWSVIQPVGRRRVSEGTGILLVAGTLMQSGVLGAALMFAQSPWYPIHAAGARAYGTTLLEDQQLAGLLMWIPASVVYLAAAAWLFLRWMRADERRQSANRYGVTTVATLVVLFAATGCHESGDVASDRIVENGNADRGRVAIETYGCGSCHSIPGIRAADGMVGPPLDHWSQRRIIAGEVPNDPERLITWITVPQSIEPGTAMPNMGVTDGQARDIAAYLYTLR